MADGSPWHVRIGNQVVVTITPAELATAKTPEDRLLIVIARLENALHAARTGLVQAIGGVTELDQ